MGKQINHKYFVIWGLIALTAIIMIITGTSFAGNPSFSSGEGNCGPLAQEAEAGNLHGAMQVGSENDISFIFSPAEEDNHKEAPHPDNRGDYCVTVTQSGTYTLKAVVNAQNMGQDSIWVVFNGQSFLWDTGFGDGFNEKPVTDRQNNNHAVEVELAAGQYVISFHQREAGVRLDRFELVPTSFAPEPTEETINENIGGEIPGGSAICGPMRQEAEQGTMFGNMRVGERDDASGGKFIFVPKPAKQGASPQDGGHRAEFCVTIPKDGNYQIKAQADAPDTSSDSLFITVDGAPSQGYLWQPREGNGFVEDLVHDRGVNDPQIIYLTQGDHQIAFHHREANTMLDWFEVEAVVGEGQPIEPTATNQPEAAATIPATATNVPPTATSIPPTATNVPPAATPEATCDSLLLEAESGILHGEFAVGNDNQASGAQ